jgi:hypothetical protein
VSARIDDQTVALVLTAFTLVVGAGVWGDMYANGLEAAAPRTLALLAFFAVFRLILGRSARPAAPPADTPPDTED